MAATHVQSFDTLLYADAVAWNGDLLACGTYQLQEDVGVRKGGVLLYKHIKTQDAKRSLILESCVVRHEEDEQAKNSEGFGVLDVKWFDKDNLVLITARANGCVELLKFRKDNDVMYSYSVSSLAIPSDKSCPISLSVDHTHNAILTSDSNGLITMGRVDNYKMGVVKQWKGHEHEAWIAVFGHDTNTILTGGDDCRLCVWDTRCDPCSCAASKRHDMGVVSIQNCPDKPNIFASGSYNEVLFLWDQRSLKRSLQELPVGGGVWRIKFNPFESNLVALACMHGGFKIVDINKNVIIGCYDGHESLAYGIDWFNGDDMGMRPSMEHGMEPGIRNGLLASCSFYDHSLQIWSFQY